MSDIITEALLEMYFLQAIVNRFSVIFGANFLKLLKPSPRQEALVGFDQGWVHSSVETKELLTELKKSISSKIDHVDNFYLGFILQYKKIKRINSRRKNFLCQVTGN